MSRKKHNSNEGSENRLYNCSMEDLVGEIYRRFPRHVFVGFEHENSPNGASDGWHSFRGPLRLVHSDLRWAHRVLLELGGEQSYRQLVIPPATVRLPGLRTDDLMDG